MRLLSLACTGGRYGLTAAALALCSLNAAAQSNYSDKDFSVRLPPAFLRFTEVSTMGGETVANRYSSASNPASAGWLAPPTPLGIIMAPYYSAIGFQEGQWLHLTGESLTWFTKDWGAFQPTLSQIRSNNSRDSGGLSFDYQVDTAQFQWGKRFGDWGLGAMFNFARARWAGTSRARCRCRWSPTPPRRATAGGWAACTNPRTSGSWG